MTTTEAVAAAKARLFISNTDFDTQLEGFFDTSVDRLNPRIQKEVASQTKTVTVDDYGETTVDLSTLTTPLADVRLVEATEGNEWYDAPSIFRHGVTLRVRQLSSSVSQLRLYGLNPYVVASATVDLPERYELPVIWYMMSEFFDMLSGNKSKFNVYTQQAGGNAVEDMRAQSQYFEAKADAYVDEKAQLYGSQ
jgi:hypothetical protein